MKPGWMGLEVIQMKENKLFYVLLLVILTTQFVIADDWYDKKGDYYKVYNMDNNEILFKTARVVTKDDQYLSSENKMYKVIKTNKKSNCLCTVCRRCNIA